MNSKLKGGSVVALMAATALLAVPVQAEQQFLVALDTPDGIVQRVIGQSELDATLTCLMDAPMSPECKNGPVTRVSGASHGIMLPIPSGTNTPAGNIPFKQVRVLSILTSDTTERIFHCTIWQAPNASPTFLCGNPASTGTFPPIGAQMTQTGVGLFTLSNAANSPFQSDQTTEQLYLDAGLTIPGLGHVTMVLTF